MTRRPAASARARRACAQMSRIVEASRRPDSASTRWPSVSEIASAAMAVVEAMLGIDEVELRADDADAIALAQHRFVALRDDARAAAIHLHGDLPPRPFVDARPLGIRSPAGGAQQDDPLVLHLWADLKLRHAARHRAGRRHRRRRRRTERWPLRALR